MILSLGKFFFDTGREVFRPISFGNGQNGKKEFSPRNRERQWQNHSVNKRERPETETCHFFVSFVDVVAALTC